MDGSWGNTRVPYEEFLIIMKLHASIKTLHLQWDRIYSGPLSRYPPIHHPEEHNSPLPQCVSTPSKERDATVTLRRHHSSPVRCPSALPQTGTPTSVILDGSAMVHKGLPKIHTLNSFLPIPHQGESTGKWLFGKLWRHRGRASL